MVICVCARVCVKSVIARVRPNMQDILPGLTWLGRRLDGAEAESLGPLVLTGPGCTGLHCMGWVR